MTYTYHWRKAMTVSVCLHIFLLLTSGYLMAGLTAPLPRQEEVLLEMDLVNDPAERIENNTAASESVLLPEYPKPAPTEIPSVMPNQTETATSESEPVVTTSELSMTAAEVPASAPVHNQAANSGTAPTVGTSAAGSGPRGTIAAPGILAKVDPVYPSAARQASLEGTVTLRIQILANGRPGEIEIIRSTGYSVLDDAAVAAVKKWMFVPAKDRSSGRAVACTTTLPVSFRLHDQQKR